MVKQIKYVAASDQNEAWHRFQAKLYSDTLEEAHEASEDLYNHDSCEPKCRYDIYEVKVEIENVDDGYGL